MESVNQNMQRLTRRSRKRTCDMFLNNIDGFELHEEESTHSSDVVKLHAEYGHLRDGYADEAAFYANKGAQTKPVSRSERVFEGAGVAPVHPVRQTLPLPRHADEREDEAAEDQFRGSDAPVSAASAAPDGQMALVPSDAGVTSTALIRRAERKPMRPKPVWHPPFKLKTVISGHQGWVRTVAVEPGNEWFVTGSADRTIKLWDLADGSLRLTLTGHISAVRGVVVSSRHPYLFSVGEDKTVKCWDLETNKVIRSYHGHLSGVYCVGLHPVLDVLITGGRDSCARVWDMRTKVEVHTLAGHTHTVGSLAVQGSEPQVITGSYDATVRLWDLAAGKTLKTLTHHKKSIRALCISMIDYTFLSASSDNIKSWKCPEGQFLRNLHGHTTILNSISTNSDGVLVSCGDNGTMYLWDLVSGTSYQQLTTTVQPGSMESEAGIFGSSFDQTGTRLITGEADKSVKIWMADPDAAPLDA